MSVLLLIQIYGKRSNCMKRRELDPFVFTKKQTRAKKKIYT